MNDIVIYKDGSVVLETTMDEETVWLTQKQISELFDVKVPAVSRHLKNIFDSGELDEKVVISKMETTTQHGAIEGKTQKRMTNFYNLDAIISVGYRVNSKRATQFRQWATRVLRQHLVRGYTLDQRRLDLLEEKQLLTDKKLARVMQAIEDDSLRPRQGVFYDGEVFDAYVFVSDLIRRARDSIVLIDNYIDETVLTLFGKNPDIDVTIYTRTIDRQLRLDLEKYNAQHRPITIRTFRASHDRFLILDGQEVYHFGASLKDLGKKWFAFSRFDLEALGMLERLSG